MEETLRGIAARNCITVWAIQNASGIWNTNLIYAGQVLYIPTGWCGWCQPHPGPCGIHIVCWGETLSGIARHYGVGPWAIAAANGIYKMNLSCADKRLAIPCDARSAVLDGRTCPVQMWHEMASVPWIGEQGGKSWARVASLKETNEGTSELMPSSLCSLSFAGDPR